MARRLARIYERDRQCYLCFRSMLVGQSALHREDMLAALRLAVDRREQLPTGCEILIGEADAIGYEVMQDTLGGLMHDSETWLTLRVRKPLAAARAGGSQCHRRRPSALHPALHGGHGR